MIERRITDTPTECVICVLREWPVCPFTLLNYLLGPIMDYRDSLQPSGHHLWSKWHGPQGTCAQGEEKCEDQ